MRLSPKRKRKIVNKKLGIADSLTLADLCVYSPFTVEEIKYGSRLKELKEWRQVLSAYLYGQGYSYPEVGRMVNNHYTTIIHSVKSITNLLETKDEVITNLVAYLQQISAPKSIKSEYHVATLRMLESHAYLIRETLY